ncbi:MAG TPA: hypothetical protein VF422_08450 [Dokdonella sp.]
MTGNGRHRSAVRIVLVAALVALATILGLLKVPRHDSSRHPVAHGDTTHTAESAAGDRTGIESEAMHATDLLDILDETYGKTDLESLSARARALDECHLLSVSPGYFEQVDSASAESIYGRNLPFVRKHAPVFVARCARVAAVMKPRTTDLLAALVAAASAGDLWASAKLFRRDGHDLSLDESDGVLGRILASRDPDAILALADYMFMPRDGSKYAELAGSNLHAEAWRLAACDLGVDCSATGRLMRDACLFGGICGEYPDWRSMLASTMLSPQDYARVEHIEAAILRTVRSN